MDSVQLRGYCHQLTFLCEQGRPHLIETPCRASRRGSLYGFDSLGQIQSLLPCDVLLFEEPIHLRFEGMLVKFIVEGMLGETVFYLAPEADAQRLQANSRETFHKIIHRYVGIRADKYRMMYFKVSLKYF